MKENLIYGNSILDFGAVGDGNSDDTEAFEKAFDSGVTLICIPFGHYTVKKELKLKSGVKLISHSRTVIDYVGITAEPNSIRTVISGGNWNNTDKENCAFDFTDCQFCTVENAEIISASDCGIGFCGCKNMTVENVSISSSHTASGIILGADVSFIRLKNLTFSKCLKAIELASGCYTYGLNADSLSFNECHDGFYAKNCILSNSVISDIIGNVSKNAICFDGAEITDSRFKDISIYDGYILLEDTKMYSFDINRFNRLAEKEADTSKPSLAVKNCPECTLICDGIPLDAVILSKKSVPDVKMTAAKMVSPFPTVYNYTIELPLDRQNNYVIPTGGFEALNLFSEKD